MFSNESYHRPIRNSCFLRIIYIGKIHGNLLVNDYYTGMFGIGGKKGKKKKKKRTSGIIDTS